LSWIVFNSSVYGFYFVMGLTILSGLFSVLKFQIQPKLTGIMCIGLLSIGIIPLYSFFAFDSFGVWEILPIILFDASSVYVAKAFTIMQELKKSKK
jgi:hypothetical protein